MKKMIKTEAEYDEAMARLEELMLANPDEGTDEANELELTAHLLEVYEKDHVDIPPPTPIEAIKFRMDQQGLKQKDLIPMLGNKARVSEVLSGKRELTVTMARNLSRELNIPANTLIGVDCIPTEIDTGKYPLKEMHKNGYFGEIDWKELKIKAEDCLHKFFDGAVMEPIKGFNRNGFKDQTQVDEFALQAWRCWVLQRSEEVKAPTFHPGDLTDEFVKGLVMLTQFDSGPELVQQALLDKGVIVLMDMKHLPKTYLDGAAMLNRKGNPVIALTFRHNRLDNFWHTLFHELGHVKKHLQDGPEEGFFDDTEAKHTAKVEREADQFALDSLIPPEKWEGEIRHLERAGEIRAAAKQLGISPSIIAGRLRKEHKNYSLHRTLVGSGTLRA